MENLKFYLVLAITMAAISVYSQTDYPAMQEAFSNSYTLEYNGDYTGAIDALKKVYQEDNYEVNLRLGWLHYMAGLFTESITYYQRAITLKPLSIEARLGLALPASALGNWEQVKKAYRDILEIDPNNSLTNYRMGSIFYGEEDYTTALPYFEKVLNLYPFDYDAMLMTAWTNLKLGKLREAEVLFNKVLLYKPNDTSATEGLNQIK
ncbi:MAG: hypothetical protein Kow00127_18780 [Bacteroidales bacterium]